jgi:hypothetical protein
MQRPAATPFGENRPDPAASESGTLGAGAIDLAAQPPNVRKRTSAAARFLTAIQDER